MGAILELVNMMSTAGWHGCRCRMRSRRILLHALGRKRLAVHGRRAARPLPHISTMSCEVRPSMACPFVKGGMQVAEEFVSPSGAAWSSGRCVRACGSGQVRAR